MSELRFECTGCGRCCRNNGEYAHVYLNDREADALAEHLALDLVTFLERYAFVDEDGWTQLRTTGQRCLFLDDSTNQCRVYEARPTQCRTFPFWKETIRDGRWTDDVREICEGVGRGRLYSIEEIVASMREMEQAED